MAFAWLWSAWMSPNVHPAGLSRGRLSRVARLQDSGVLRERAWQAPLIRRLRMRVALFSEREARHKLQSVKSRIISELAH